MTLNTDKVLNSSSETLWEHWEEHKDLTRYSRVSRPGRNLRADPGECNEDRKVEPSMFLGLKALIIWRNSLRRKRGLPALAILWTLCVGRQVKKY